MSNTARQQSLVFKNIYEFNDPSGSLLAAKVPPLSSVDLYDGTAVVVRPNQCAIFVYKGQIAEVLPPGTHFVNTANFPVLTRLANWRFGFESPLRAELFFLSGQEFTARRWGSPQPFLANMENYGPVPFRAFGTYNFAILNPRTFFSKLVGTRTTYTVADLEDFLQAEILELLPKAFSKFTKIEQVATAHQPLSAWIEENVNHTLQSYGLILRQVQLLSALPSQEILRAIESRTAIQMVGSQDQYLMYKAANALSQPSQGNGSDPMHVLMGLLMSRGIAGNPNAPLDKHYNECPQCSARNSLNAKFCSQCGGRF